MFPKISNITCIVLIDIYTSLIDITNRLATNIDASLINNKNDINNYGKDLEDCILAIKFQETLERAQAYFQLITFINILNLHTSSYFALSLSSLLL